MELTEAKKIFPPIWVIYDNPKDHPGYFVIRAHYGRVPDNWCELYPTLEAARMGCGNHGACVKFLRDETDDPVIVESWI